MKFLNINITSFFGPGVYLFHNKKLNRFYIGETNSIIARLDEHLANLKSKRQLPDPFINDWNASNADFSITALELGQNFYDRSYRVFFENGYLFKLFTEEGPEKIYNILNQIIIARMENAYQKSLKEKTKSLSFLNADLTWLQKSGIYAIKNKKTTHVYIGQASNLIGHLTKQMGLLNNGTHPDLIFQKLWRINRHALLQTEDFKGSFESGFQNEYLKKVSPLINQQDFSFEILEFDIANHEGKIYKKEYQKFYQNQS